MVGRAVAVGVAVVAATSCGGSHDANAVPCAGTARVCRTVETQARVYEQSGATPTQAACLANITARMNVGGGTKTVIVSGALQRKIDACGISARVFDKIGAWTREHLPLPPVSSTTTSTTGPILGRVTRPYEVGFGAVRPPEVSLGGDPTSLVTNIRWTTWGGARAVGSGISSYDPPNKIVADSILTPATIVAFHRGTCQGAEAYTAVEWYFPAHGGKFDPHRYFDACTGAFVGGF